MSNWQTSDEIELKPLDRFIALTLVFIFVGVGLIGAFGLIWGICVAIWAAWRQWLDVGIWILLILIILHVQGLFIVYHFKNASAKDEKD